ncbi:unnamed protein product, partial [Chrysoparadoxa australica]
GGSSLASGAGGAPSRPSLAVVRFFGLLERITLKPGGASPEWLCDIHLQSTHGSLTAMGCCNSSSTLAVVGEMATSIWAVLDRAPWLEQRHF